MTGPALTALAAVASTIWGYVKWPITQIMSAFRLNAKVAEIEKKLETLDKQPPPPSPFRKCQNCGERDLRLQDTYRYRADVFDEQRYFHQKWLCFSCGFRDEVNLPEPGG
jgi:hypothetical protein